MDEIERNNNFDDVADKIVNKYTSMTTLSSPSGSNENEDAEDKNDGNNGNKDKMTTSELDDIFATNTHKGHSKQPSDSGIGNAGTLIFDNYDEDILFRDAYESPKPSPKTGAVNHEDMLQKRPSIELDLDGNDTDNNKDNDNDKKSGQFQQNDARGTAPNSPAAISYEDEEDETPR